MEPLLPADDPEVAALDAEEAAIRQAEAAYRGDTELAADLEASGWFAERTAAAKRGEAIGSNGRRQAEPTIRLPVQQGQVAFKPSPWAGFTSMLAEVNKRRVELLERRRPEILAKLAERETQLRGRVLAARVRDLGPLVEQADELLASAVAARGPIPRTVRTSSGLAPASYRERTDAVELVDHALAGASLLDPLPADEPVSIVTGSYGIQPDSTPSPTVQQVRDATRRYGTTRTR